MENETQRRNNANNPRYVRPKPGPQTQGRNRDLENVSTRQKFEFPEGANITELTIFCQFNAIAATADLAAARSHLYAQLVIDAIDDNVADALMTKLNSAVDDNGYIPIKIGDEKTITLKEGTVLKNGSLGGGRIDVKCSDGSTGLDFWIGGN